MTSRYSSERTVIVVGLPFKSVTNALFQSARLSIIHTNNTANTQYARLYVGGGGKGEQSLLTEGEDGAVVTPENYIVGTDGANGFARVSSAV